jgi:cobalamin biosynthesis protein CobD/CbiB
MILAPPRTLVKVRVCVLNHIPIRLFVIIFAIREEVPTREPGEDALSVAAEDLAQWST